MMFSLFYFVVIGGSLFQLFGPLTYVRSNSMFYSAKAPKKERYPDLELPHITIQMPVYKEGLKGYVDSHKFSPVANNPKCHHSHRDQSTGCNQKIRIYRWDCVYLCQ